MIPLIEHFSNKRVFTENGIFVVPDGIDIIFVSAIAAGGDGGGNGGGGSGEFCIEFPIKVMPKQIIDIVVGSGNTIIGGFMTLLKGGNGSNDGGGSGGAGGGAYGSSSYSCRGGLGRGGGNGADGASGRGGAGGGRYSDGIPATGYIKSRKGLGGGGGGGDTSAGGGGGIEPFGIGGSPGINGGQGKGYGSGAAEGIGKGTPGIVIIECWKG